MFGHRSSSVNDELTESVSEESLNLDGNFREGDFTICKMRSPGLMDRFGPGPYVAEVMRPKIVSTMLVKIRGDMVSVPQDSCQGRYTTQAAAKAGIRRF